MRWNMKKERQYYEAYDDRYRQVHQKSLKWFSDSPSQIVEETLQKYKTDDRMKILEIGCGREGTLFICWKKDIM